MAGLCGKVRELARNAADYRTNASWQNSEEIVGKALARYGLRERVVVATKAGLEWTSDEKVFRNASRERILKECDDSLRRLGTDYIDIYQIHWPDPLVPVEETARAMYEQYLNAVSALERFARDRYGKTVLQLAVRWVLDQPGASVALWGARRPDQLDPVSGVFGWSLDAGAMKEIDRILAENISSPVGPEFMAPPPRTGQRAMA